MAKGKPVPLVKITVDGAEVDAKECTKCGEIKALTGFNKSLRGVGGRRSYCKTCEAVPADRRKDRKKKITIIIVNGEEVKGKKCSRCGETKPLSSFQRDSHKPGGTNSACRKCNTKTGKEKKYKLPIEMNVEGFLVVVKECAACGQHVPLSMFANERSGGGGKRHICKNCHNNRSRVKRTFQGKGFLLNDKLVEVPTRCGTRKPEKDKTCTRCLEVLPLHKFKKNVQGLGGVSSECNECSKERGRRNYYSNKEDLIKRNAEWYAKNRGWSRAKEQRRRTIKWGLPYDWSPSDSDISEMMSYCLEEYVGTSDLQLDHFIPLAIGHGGTYLANMSAMTKRINASKNASNPFDWFEENRQRFGLDPARFDALVAKLAEQNGLTPEEFREYTDWCFANPRNPTQIERDNTRYGYRVTSVELWREATKVRAKQVIA